MQLRSFLRKWGLDCLKLRAPFLEAELIFQTEDQRAAWELYVEMLTRIASQELPPEHGDEGAALGSLHLLFPITRDILKRYGQSAICFAKIAVPILNQIVRPLTAKWHPIILKGALTSQQKADFRSELREVQTVLRRYMRLLADMADVEDLTELREHDA
ncbi:MAG: hypothetical protein WAN43_00800 [Rhodomicrobium sp.]|jgi:hypothetical protein